MSSQSGLMKMLQKASDKMRVEYELIRYYDFCFARQLFTDLAQIALEEAFGEEATNMVEPFVNALTQLHDQFCDVWDKDSKDVEYSIDILDRRLKTICGDKFLPPSVRYEGIKFKGKDLKFNDISESA